MRILAIILSAVTVTVVLAHCLPLVAGPAHSPHENPVTAAPSSDPMLLLLFHSNVFSLAVGGRYADARNLLNESEHASIPAGLRYIADRYDAISRDLLATLDNLDSLLDEASSLLLQYRLAEASERLSRASSGLDRAWPLMAELQAATEVLLDRLGVAAAEAKSRAGQERDRLLEICGRLEQLVAKLDELWRSLSSRYQAQMQEKRVPTDLTLQVAPAAVFVGDTVAVSGRLTDGSGPLAKRELVVLVGGERVAVTTDTHGVYSADVAVPYRYADSMTLKAQYTPAGEDLPVYMPSESSPVVIDTSFYQTFLTVLVAEVAHPGLPLTVEGEVGSTGSALERVLRLVVDGTLLTEERVNGRFQLSVGVPEEMSVGEHSLTAAVLSEGPYSGASVASTINVSRLPVQADVRTSATVVLPGSVQVSGRVYGDYGPAANARVMLALGRSSASEVRASADGTFATTLAGSLDLSVAGPQAVRVRIEPAEAYYESLDLHRSVFAINPVSVGFLLAGVVSVGVFAYRRAARKPAGTEAKATAPRTEGREAQVLPPSPRPRQGLAGTRGGVMSAYLDALETLERVTGIRMEASQTVREFLRTVTARAVSGRGPFADLTLMAEVALYSAHEPGEEMVATAARLAAAVAEEIRRDAA